MDVVKIKDFPSDTNWSNFQYDMNIQLPGVPYEIDHSAQAMLIQVQYYEDHQDLITEFAKDAGGVVVYDLVDQ